MRALSFFVWYHPLSPLFSLFPSFNAVILVVYWALPLPDNSLGPGNQYNKQDRRGKLETMTIKYEHPEIELGDLIRE